MKYFTFSLLIIINAIAYNVSACSCEGWADAYEEFRSADIVLAGTALNREILTSSEQRQVNHYKFIVSTLYKGKLTSDTVNVYTGLGDGECGWDFKIGQRYIVYGYKNKYASFLADAPSEEKNVLWTNICLRTMPFNEEEANEIKEIAARNNTK